MGAVGTTGEGTAGPDGDARSPGRRALTLTLAVVGILFAGQFVSPIEGRFAVQAENGGNQFSAAADFDDPEAVP